MPVLNFNLLIFSFYLTLNKLCLNHFNMLDFTDAQRIKNYSALKNIAIYIFKFLGIDKRSLE